jgi:hypothetical protein
LMLLQPELNPHLVSLALASPLVVQLYVFIEIFCPVFPIERTFIGYCSSFYSRIMRSYVPVPQGDRSTWGGVHPFQKSAVSF